MPTGADRCPDCGADMSPYRDINVLAGKYLELGKELLSRGEVDAAQKIIEQLPQLGGAANDELLELRARVALANGNFIVIKEALPTLPPPIAAELEAELTIRQTFADRARELYNYALSAARSHEYQRAARLLTEAASAAPENPNIWVLKLKIDLKAHNWFACYHDLSVLDSLSSRPAEFHRLEELLPPVTS